jgi:choline dehydrogenase-like flavoprotein
MSQVIRSPKTYDVIVVGSGAGGGMAAKILTEGGLNVALLEAGPPVNPEKDYKMFMWPYDLPHRGVGVGGLAAQNFGEFLAPNGAWEIAGEPYTSAPGSDFRWFRSRIVGGRTNHWGRIALRFSPIDFKSYSRDGLGSDWPISYDDIAPYYDKVDSYIGVFGTKENISSAPDGVFLPQTEHYLYPGAAGDSHEVGERATALPLLRAVRPRLHHRVEFQLEPGADSSRDADG